MIVNNLAAPDIVGLEEIQDNNGATGGTGSPVVDANVTLDRLVAAIQAAGGPTYSYRQINPVAHQDGGEPGGNIRVGFIFRTDRGLAFVDRPGGDSTTPVSVVAGPNGPRAVRQPGTRRAGGRGVEREPEAARGRVHLQRPQAVRDREPLQLEGRRPGALRSPAAAGPQLRGAADPAGDAARRRSSATSSRLIRRANIAVIGDLNDFQFSPPVQKLKDAGLIAMIETLPPSERYSYVFDGNSQALDHIMVSSNLLNHARGCGGLRHRARELRVHRPGVRPRSAARAADDAGADDLGLRLAGRERRRVEQHRGDGQLHLRRPAVGDRRRLPGTGDARHRGCRPVGLADRSTTEGGSRSRPVSRTSTSTSRTRR